MKKNLGIFIPFSLQHSKNHGISRLLSFILTDMAKNNDAQIFIATPCWFENDTLSFLKEQSFDFNQIQIITTDRASFYSRMMKFLLQKKLSKKNHLPVEISNQWKISESLDRNLRNFLTRYPLTQSHLLPFIKRTRQLNKKVTHFFYKNIHRVLDIVGMKCNSLLHTTYTKLRTRELNHLIDVINEKPDISAWYIPALFWPEVKNIKARKMIAVPDIVALDFPHYFSDHTARQTTKRMISSLNAGDHFICYSDHVKQKHLVEPFTIKPGKVSVIPHAPVDLSHWIPSRDHAIRILQDYQQQGLKNDIYLSDYNMADMRFIFYSSQIRPYKNLHNLIRAYEILLRERFVNIKLVLTGDIKSDPILYQTILDKRLQFDILSFHDVTPKVLAALNHLAVCAVNPTLFEGGFPFTFTEAFSVGTPSVMSTIPAVTANINDENLRAHMLFDPHDVDDMVNKIEWAIQHRAQLFEWQKPLYESFKQRDWSSVAKEYTHLLTHFSKPDYANE